MGFSESEGSGRGGAAAKPGSFGFFHLFRCDIDYLFRACL